MHVVGVQYIYVECVFVLCDFIVGFQCLYMNLGELYNTTVSRVIQMYSCSGLWALPIT